MSQRDSQALRDQGILNAKQVFLIHSGAQKEFVEQLDADLRSWDRYPFFDKDRDSIPLGEPFPKLIFDAIQKCQVGVVFLSEEFFMRSHWPMFELVKLVECGKRIMPIYLGVVPEDLGNEMKLKKWKSQWQIWKIPNARIIIPDWEKALKLLRPLNGFVYNHASSVVEFRKEIVKEINKIVPPFHRWDDSHVQGRAHLSKAICEKIAKTPMSKSYGAQVVGLYGVGGIGKTTACKFLCNDLSTEFVERVCHVEFGIDTSEKDRLHEVLKRLTETNIEVLKELTKDQCWSRLKNLMRLRKVYLAIDNVSSSSIEETKRYLRVGYCSGSIVMVTARAHKELIDLGIPDGDCLEMPDLEEDDARALFLYHAKPNNEVDKEILMHYIKRCYFSKGYDGSSHYHPLALRVLGSQLASKEPEKWEMPLKIVDIFNQNRERENPVFSILKRSFDELTDGDKSIFMDVALFDLGDDYKGSRDSGFYSMRWPWNVFEWLSMVHGQTVDNVKEGLKGLKRKSLLEELGDGTTQIGMHDLWREFAVTETRRGETESWRWVYEVMEVDPVESIMFGGGWETLQRICIMGKGNPNNDLNYSSMGAKCSVKRVDFSGCSKVKVLKLVDVVMEDQAFDLSALKQLKSLEIISSSTYPGPTLVEGIGLLSNLTILVWIDIVVDPTSVVEGISSLKNLQVLVLYCSQKDVPTTFDLVHLKWLREVKLRFSGKLTISGLSPKMTNLRILDLMYCDELHSCPGVGDVLNLEELVLRGCNNLEALPSLRKLTKLRILDIRECVSLTVLEDFGSLVSLLELQACSCSGLSALPDLSGLTNLQVVNFTACQSLKGILGLGKLTNLQVLNFTACESLKGISGLGNLTNLLELYLSYCPSLNFVSGLGNLTALRELSVGGPFLDILPDFGNLKELQAVAIRGWIRSSEPVRLPDDKFSPLDFRRVINLTIFEFVPILSLWRVDCELANLSSLRRLLDLSISNCDFQALSGLSNLTALKSLSLFECKLRRLPDMGNHMRLESLTISRCEWLIGWDGVGTLASSESHLGDLYCDWTLPRLEKLSWHNSAVVDLPDLKHFPRLRKLEIGDHMLSGSVRCQRLGFELHCVANHSKLEDLDCTRLANKELPDLSKFPSLKRLSLRLCDHLTSLTSSGPLTALETLDIRFCYSLESFPHVDLLTNLTNFSITKCKVRLNNHELEILRARHPRPYCYADGYAIYASED